MVQWFALSVKDVMLQKVMSSTAGQNLIELINYFFALFELT
jgi:hypothetical protein